ncbi:hypothetical protein Aglo01_03700 [Actinokineospora globicatena]|nr:hypothetical protein Aglo01_03700 [Actinokineospora globicatena]GLW82726.1 hypothetical protein Aglo02_03670 [Actinokineospora globicatena]
MTEHPTARRDDAKRRRELVDTVVVALAVIALWEMRPGAGALSWWRGPLWRIGGGRLGRCGRGRP